MNDPTEGLVLACLMLIGSAWELIGETGRHWLAVATVSTPGVGQGDATWPSLHRFPVDFLRIQSESAGDADADAEVGGASPAAIDRRRRRRRRHGRTRATPAGRPTAQSVADRRRRRVAAPSSDATHRRRRRDDAPVTPPPPTPPTPLPAPHPSCVCVCVSVWRAPGNVDVGHTKHRAATPWIASAESGWLDQLFIDCLIGTAFTSTPPHPPTPPPPVVIGTQSTVDFDFRRSCHRRCLRHVRVRSSLRPCVCVGVCVCHLHRCVVASSSLA